jgi:hypothetical protein
MRVDHIAKGAEQLWWAQTIFFVGLAFYGSDMFLGGSMTPTTYGYLAYDIDARSWSQGFMAASAMVLFGLYINGRWPLWTPIMRAVGWSVLALMHVLLAVSAWTAVDGLHIVIFSVLFFFRRSATFALLSIREALKRRGHGSAI